MQSRFFGQYLLEKRLIDRAALIDSIRRAREANRSIPEFAVRQGIIDQSTANNLLSMYRISDRSIEEICLQSGVLSSDQVQELLKLQKSEYRRIGDCLVEGRHLTREQVDTHIQDFLKYEKVQKQKLDSDLQGFADNKVISTCLDLTVFHFDRMTGRASKLHSIKAISGGIKENRQRYAQRIVGGIVFTLAIDLDDDLAHLLGKGLLGIDIEKDGDAARDAVCEFVNVVGGNACTHLERPGCSVRPEPPFTSGGDSPAKPDGRSICAELFSEETPFEIHVFI